LRHQLQPGKDDVTVQITWQRESGCKSQAGNAEASSWDWIARMEKAI
jgi:hypothetical protein